MKRLLLLIIGFPFFSTAQLQVAKIFSDNMVLQRKHPIHIWGKAIPGELLVVSFTKKGFSTDGINDCEATIQNRTVVIAVKEKTAFVYYGWKSFTDANLVNSEKLPALTFKINVK